MFKLNKNTQVCVSISSNPSNTGTTLHNACYKAQDLDYIYKAFQVTDLKGAIDGIRALQIKGCSVSMPFKQTVIPLLDELAPLAKRVKAVNTILNKNGILIGYNTDVLGSIKTLSHIELSPEDSVLILGGGGMARALIISLQELGIYNQTVSSRNPNRSYSLANEFNITAINWEEARKAKADVLVNATPIGMEGFPKIPIFNDEIIKNCHTIIDVVVDLNGTELNRKAIEQGKRFISGVDLAKAQMIDQYEIYTGQQPPINIIEEAFRSNGNG